MTMKTGSLFGAIPAQLPDELTQEILHSTTLRIERIVSRGHCSPQDFWYDQDEHEWVLLLSGEAKLRFQSERETLHLRPGQYLHIPAHVRHRVEWTSADKDSIWLAIFYR